MGGGSERREGSGGPPGPPMGAPPMGAMPPSAGGVGAPSPNPYTQALQAIFGSGMIGGNSFAPPSAGNVMGNMTGSQGGFGGASGGGQPPMQVPMGGGMAPPQGEQVYGQFQGRQQRLDEARKAAQQAQAQQSGLGSLANLGGFGF